MDVARIVSGRILSERAPGTRIAIVCEDSVRDAVAFFACLLSNCPPLLLRSDFPAILIQELVTRLGACILPLHTWIEEADTDTRWDLCREFATSEDHSRQLLAQIRKTMLLSASSASTGPPKVFLHSMERVLRNARAHSASVGMKAGDKVLTCLPFSFSYQSLTLLQSTILNQGTLIFSPFWTDSDFVNCFETHMPDFVNFTPYLLRSFVRQYGTQPFQRTTTVTVGGSKIEESDIAILQSLVSTGHRRCYVTYGATECGPRVTTGEIFSATRYAAGFVGTPVSNVRVRVDKNDVIEVKSPYLALGACLGPDVIPAALTGEDGWLRTSDIGHQDGDGNLYIRGRHDRLILRHDVKVSPELVESVAMSFPGVDAALVRLEELDGIDHLTCYLQSSKQSQIDVAKLRSHLKEGVPPSLVPSRFVISSAPLTNQLGKLHPAVFPARLREHETAASG